MSYPKWLYNESGSVLLRTPEEESALVGEWFDSPAKVKHSSVSQIEDEVREVVEEIQEVEKPSEISESVQNPLPETLTVRPKLGRPSLKDKQ